MTIDWKKLAVLNGFSADEGSRVARMFESIAAQQRQIWADGEVERLRAENERLGKEVEDAIVEIEALREVLAQIIAITESDGRPLKQMHEIHTLAFMTLQPNAKIRGAERPIHLDCWAIPPTILRGVNHGR